MTLKIIKETNNRLLKRKEILVSLEADSNPGFAEATKKIAEKFKANENLVAIKKVDSEFGSNEFKIDFFIYESEDDKIKTEPKKKEKKK